MKFSHIALSVVIGFVAVLKTTEAILVACPFGACLLPSIIAYVEALAAYLGITIGTLLPVYASVYLSYAITALGVTQALVYSLLPIYLDLAAAGLELELDLLEETVDFLGDWFNETLYEDYTPDWTNFADSGGFPDAAGTGSVYTIPSPGNRKLQFGEPEGFFITFNFTGLAGCDDCWLSITEGGACVVDWLEGADGIMAGPMNVTADGNAEGVMTFDENIKTNIGPAEGLAGATMVIGRADGTAIACAVLESVDAGMPSGGSPVPGSVESMPPSGSPGSVETMPPGTPGPSPTPNPTTATTPSPTTSGAFSLTGFFVPAAAIITSSWMIA